ncbi:MAG: hypothetical protein H6585_09405 [Flavobacteriales bacterium]|nr:hypothetical protein [Flavobacteriales bacterium]MCB9448545.1 hypothetical protein [Flavobacteriales bacterium]
MAKTNYSFNKRKKELDKKKKKEAKLKQKLERKKLKAEGGVDDADENDATGSSDEEE